MKAAYRKCHTEHFNKQRGQNTDNARVYLSVKLSGPRINYQASLQNVFGLNIMGSCGERRKIIRSRKIKPHRTGSYSDLCVKKITDKDGKELRPTIHEIGTEHLHDLLTK
jgi:hypothetical protein